MPVKQINGTNGTNGTNGNGGPISNGVNGTNGVHKPVEALNLPITQSGFMCKEEPQHETKKNERTYPVSDPVRPSTFEQCHEPLPFPGSLKGVISWTDAFIDRIAYMVEQHETVLGFFILVYIYLYSFVNRKKKRQRRLSPS